MNHLHVDGHLTKDPEVITLKNGSKKTIFCVVNNSRPYEKNGQRITDPTFFNCEAWDSGGEIIARDFRKGDLILVHGEHRQHRWKTDDGEEHERWLMRVRDFDYPKPAPQRARMEAARANGGNAPADAPAASAPPPAKKGRKPAQPAPAPAPEADGDDTPGEVVPF